jgi:hypothetical protein
LLWSSTALQIVDPIDRMIGNVVEDGAEVFARIKALHLCCLEETVNRSGPIRRL